MSTLEGAGTRRPRVLVVGCGGIGGIVAGSLLSHPEALRGEVVGLSTNPRIAEAVNEHGYRARGVGGSRVSRGRVVTSLDPAEPAFDWVILAVQPPQVEAAAREALPWLAPDGAIVCLQNGLCEERVARIVGPDAVISS